MEKLSKARCAELDSLKQKKFRQEKRLVIIEGERLFHQLRQYKILPLELYTTEATPPREYPGVPWFQAEGYQLSRICDGINPPHLAGLFRVPEPVLQDFQTAFYLDNVADPGNTGTIFRLAAAFGIEAILLSPDTCEISSPKVIRASLGAVYKVPWQEVSPDKLHKLGARIVCLDMQGQTTLKDYRPQPGKTFYVLGSEAHGISPEVLSQANQTLSIGMSDAMESLNVAITAGILAHHLY